MKTCTGCKEAKPFEAFARQRRNTDGLQYRCRDCQRAYYLANVERNRERDRKRWKTYDANRREEKRAYARGYWISNQEKALSSQYRSRYGITLADYQVLVETQDNKCAICRRKRGKKRLHVDHDHATGVVRGLLCQQCNHALGLFQDDPERLLAAVTYLTTFRG